MNAVAKFITDVGVKSYPMTYTAAAKKKITLPKVDYEFEGILLVCLGVAVVTFIGADIISVVLSTAGQITSFYWTFFSTILPTSF